MPDTTLKTTDMLVVDPRPEDYQHLAVAPLGANYDLEFATSGDNALRRALNTAFDLWLINFRLPDMTGEELLTTVRARNPAAACILISDIYSTADELSARQLGATLYVCKPLQADWLRSLPVLRTPSYRDHSAHGPPTAPISSQSQAHLRPPPTAPQRSKS